MVDLIVPVVNWYLICRSDMNERLIRPLWNFNSERKGSRNTAEYIIEGAKAFRKLAALLNKVYCLHKSSSYNIQ